MAGSLQAMNTVRVLCSLFKALLTPNLAINASPLSELRIALGQSSSDEEATFTSQVKLDLGSNVPLFICLASGENKLVVASSSVITTWDAQAVLRGEVSYRQVNIYTS